MAVEVINTTEESLKRRVDELEIKLILMEKAVEFLAERLDEAMKQNGIETNAEYLIKHILQK
ncbi:hypothetical protein [Persephonella sp.]